MNKTSQIERTGIRMKERRMIKLNNTGSTILLVIIAMAFIGILASLVLSISVTNLQIKSVDQNAKANFYSAEKALDEIKTGLEELASTALESAYNTVLAAYSDLPVGERSAKIREEFLQNLQSALWIGDDSADHKKQCDVMVLDSFLEMATSAYISSTEPSGQPILEYKFNDIDKTDQFLYIRNISITYIDSSNYRSNITTDIHIVPPEIELESQGSKPSYCEYALISDNILSADNPVTSCVINGNVYAANKILAKSPVTTLSLFSENVVTRNMIEIAEGAELVIGQDTNPSKIWASNIETTQEISSGATATIIGDSYIADDLTLNAKYSNVTLKNGYYGYGYGTTSGTSSAMLINKSNCTLNLSEITIFY